MLKPKTSNNWAAFNSQVNERRSRQLRQARTKTVMEGAVDTPTNIAKAYLGQL